MPPQTFTIQIQSPKDTGSEAEGRVRLMESWSFNFT